MDSIKMIFDTKQYWDNRLADFSLESVGNLGLGYRFNRYLYKSKVRSINRIKKKCNLSFADKTVLDIGTGTGFWIDYYLKEGASYICGVDISSVAVHNLRLKYKNINEVSICQADFGSNNLSIDKKFDVVNAMDVAYHVVDENSFEIFVKNACDSLANGGFLFLTDVFRENIPTPPHVKFRSLVRYKKLLNLWGVNIVAQIPMYFFLNYPSDINSATFKRLMRTIFQATTVLSRSFFGEIYLVMLYTMDCILTNFQSLGVSTKLLFGCKK